ncbi:hypothetical protein VitviT2T_001572 [Vitis vinifera]|uniref:Kinesin motor domain-containing protein n=1 Tax=Vitis vinifera TaxID=29760 RepID=A0ABY9BFX3_VITVI|nr:hypothetical protein VitviT2T_001572 [Vitis vinifera]
MLPLLCLNLAEVVWNHGLLKRVGVCHGISGNAYVFLSLYRLTCKMEFVLVPCWMSLLLMMRVAEDLIRWLHQPTYRNQRFKLWLNYFEMYGGKFLDLLSDRKKLCMREDRRQQACIVGLQEFEVLDAQIVKEILERSFYSMWWGLCG